jgi:hypothetical protein
MSMFMGQARRGPYGNDPLMGDPVVMGWTRPAPAGQELDYLVGLGLGKANGPAALVVVERTPKTKDEPARYAVTHAQRWPAATPYSDMATAVGAVVAPLARGRLLIDAALGRAVVEQFRPYRGRLAFTPVLLTDEPGAVIRWDELGWAHTPANEVAAAVLALLGQRRLKFGPVPDHAALRRGLELFSGKAGLLTKLTAKVWGLHEEDSLVVATALAAWGGENACRRGIM